MIETLLWSSLSGVCVCLILIGVLLWLTPKAFTRSAIKVRDELRAGREESQSSGIALRQEVSVALMSANDTLSATMDRTGKAQQSQLQNMNKQVHELTESNRANLDRIRGTLDERVKELQTGNEDKVAGMRKEVADGLKSTNETLTKTSETMSSLLGKQLEALTKGLKDQTASNREAFDQVRQTLDTRVKELQDGNEKKLDQMRKTVDEKLHDTLEKRLGESFKLVSDRLEAVHQGLGEMQNLATGVGDLKRVLTNVKARGTWAEVQLGSILEQILSPQQYEKNAQIKRNSSERVEYAIRLPGPKDDPSVHVLLPIDSKFPQEDFVRLQEAADRADADGVQKATKELNKTVRNAAKEIHQKYVNPPATTDFAIMFLATEGLYAEVLRQPALVDELQRSYRVVIAGPTTLAALLNSLRMGFQTVAIEERAIEVWRVLAAVKTEFGRFGDVMAKVKKQLATASKTIDQTDVRQRAMARKLRSVEQLPDTEAAEVLALPSEPGN